MNGRTLVLTLAVGAACFGLGWLMGGSNASDASDASSPLAGLGTGNSMETFEAIMLLDDPAERATRLAAFLEETDVEMAPELRARLVRRDNDLIVDEIAEALIARWWAEADPAAAFHGVVNPFWGDRHPWMREVIRVWTRREPTEAAIAVLEIPAGPARGRLQAARVAVDEWLALERMPDPTPILMVIKHLEPIARGGAVQHLVDSMIERDGIDRTLEFVRNVPPDPDGLGGSVQHEILARTAIVLLDHDVERAIEWAREQADGPAGPGVHKHLAYYWAIRDGQAAMEWALTLPDGPLRPAVLKRAWMSFGRKHPDEAREWLHARVPDERLQGIYGRHLRALAENDPDKALALAERAEDEDLRQRMRAAAGRGWMKSDPEAATAWLAQAGLPEDLANQVRAAATTAAPPARGASNGGA